MTNPSILTVYGALPNSEIINLYAGWNLVGYPTLENSTTATDALMGTGYDHIEGFNASAPYLISELSGAYLMQPGEGYWIHVSGNAAWTVLCLPPSGGIAVASVPPGGVNQVYADDMIQVENTEPDSVIISETTSHNMGEGQLESAEIPWTSLFSQVIVFMSVLGYIYARKLHRFSKH